MASYGPIIHLPATFSRLMDQLWPNYPITRQFFPVNGQLWPNFPVTHQFFPVIGQLWPNYPLTCHFFTVNGPIMAKFSSNMPIFPSWPNYPLTRHFFTVNGPIMAKLSSNIFRPVRGIFWQFTVIFHLSNSAKYDPMVQKIKIKMNFDLNSNTNIWLVANALHRCPKSKCDLH